MKEVLDKILQAINKQNEALNAIMAELNRTKGIASEALWANIFHDTINTSKWLKQKAFHPGRWAMGYPALYAIYRVLDSFKPKSILELGLGESTKVIAQYASSDDISHIVVEANKEWIEFFKNNFELSKNTSLEFFEYEMRFLNSGAEVRVFKDFAKKFSQNKFNFILIDAPFGADMKDFSRIDILSILPNCLNDDFVIMLDDCQRTPEINTLKEITKTLSQNNIAHKIGIYSGEKQTALICSQKLAFLASM